MEYPVRHPAFTSMQYGWSYEPSYSAIPTEDYTSTYCNCYPCLERECATDLSARLRSEQYRHQNMSRRDYTHHINEYESLPLRQPNCTILSSSDIKIPSGILSNSDSRRNVFSPMKDCPTHDAAIDKNNNSRQSLPFGIDNILKERLTPETHGYHDHLNKTHTSRYIRRTSSSSTGGQRRAVFTESQRRELEAEFMIHKYINKIERKQLSARLGLTESQIRIWFQNQRMKWRNIQEREMMKNKQFHFRTPPFFP